MGWSLQRRCWIGALLAAPMALGHAQTPKDGNSIYSCLDASGRRITADRPISACLDREQRVLGPSGVEKARLGPSLSEKDKYEAEQRQRRAEREHVQAQGSQRREQALLQRYPRPELHQTARRAALAQIDEVIALAGQRMESLRIERGQQEQEMAFYSKDPTMAPSALQRNLAEIDAAMDRQLRYVQSQQQERRRIQQRFDSEQQQMQRLWLQEAEGAAP